LSISFEDFSLKFNLGRIIFCIMSMKNDKRNHSKLVGHEGKVVAVGVGKLGLKFNFKLWLGMSTSVGILSLVFGWDWT